MSNGWITSAELMEWSFAVFLCLLQVLILWLIWRASSGKPGIDLSRLVSEKDGVASLSRFQALLFTFVVVGVYAFKAFKTGTWPEIDTNTLYLLAGSGGTYLASKGIQKNAEAKSEAAAAGKLDSQGRFVR